MGNHLSPIIAHIVIKKVLNDTIKKLYIKLKIVCKYVDDLFGILKKAEINSTLFCLNSQEKNNNCFPYLNVRVMRNGTNITLDRYQKQISSERLVNYI